VKTAVLKEMFDELNKTIEPKVNISNLETHA
jgi:hypothetical protein